MPVKLTAQETKEMLLQTAKDMIAKDLVEGTSGNLSARLPDGNAVLTPGSLAYETMTLDDLVVCDIDGNVLEGTRSPTSEKDLHLECLREHEDINAVMHCHAKFSTMFAVTRTPIPCVIEEVHAYIGGDVGVADYQFTGSKALGREVARHVGDRAAVLMANHGLLTVGKNPQDCLKLAMLVERTAEIVWGAHVLGKLVPLPDSTVDKMAPVYKNFMRIM
ncbi:MAG TPA: class II aldolase/adducin family protein [Acidimicrobiia bacterium]|jgi:L-fuculose-phosphate aldolase